MAEADPGDIARARLDREGRLLSADPKLLALNARAGGAIGRLLALPQVATLAKLAARLEIPVSRPAIAGDSEHDFDLWIDAQPVPEGVALEVSGWKPLPPRMPAFPDIGEMDAIGDWSWQTDAQLRLVSLSLDGDVPFDASRLIGRPLTRVFALEEEDDGSLPILAATAAGADFDGQRAIVRDTGAAVLLSASALRDRRDRLTGYVGRAVRAPDSGDERLPPVIGADFAERLGRALRRPLSRIVANADSISARSEGPLRADYVDYASDIASAGRHLLGLIDDLADLEAIERADFRAEQEPVDLADIARRAAGLLAVRASDRGIRIDRPGAEEAMPAIGDFRRVLQILVNLIGNAVRYTPEGGMVWIRTEREGDLATVIVADQGRGIAASDHARVFEKFERIDPSEPGGSGLGLYIARRLARAMGGDISIDSAPGQGARFALTLPARD
ncbi:sensor histidine kinase [Sphingomonas gilva]|uniref:histidine kinase n=1 Tax=Sphingomonas gilva TaxID=2305907 RepID=A0A396RJN2_9SPHN|nr:HAMP domain-containing sensor histidine kinase [Sphingomonas gilva]RHW16374.1 sensor histidine kinase [Sphingomonas gilva]